MTVENPQKNYKISSAFSYNFKSLLTEQLKKENGMGAVSEWNQGEGARDCERTDYIRLAKGERRNPFLFIMQLKL